MSCMPHPGRLRGCTGHDRNLEQLAPVYTLRGGEPQGKKPTGTTILDQDKANGSPKCAGTAWNSAMTIQCVIGFIFRSLSLLSLGVWYPSRAACFTAAPAAAELNVDAIEWAGRRRVG